MFFFFFLLLINLAQFYDSFVVRLDVDWGNEVHQSSCLCVGFVRPSAPFSLKCPPPSQATHGLLTVVHARGWGIWTGNFKSFQRNTYALSFNMEELKSKEFTFASRWLWRKVGRWSCILQFEHNSGRRGENLNEPIFKSSNIRGEYFKAWNW